MLLPPRQRRLEPDPEEPRDAAPRRAHRKGRVRADVAGRFEREVEPDLAATRVRAELRDGRGRRTSSETRAEHEPARAADDRPFVDERAEPRRQREGGDWTRVHGAREP